MPVNACQRFANLAIEITSQHARQNFGGQPGGVAAFASGQSAKNSVI
jgi:hypothetical protein